MRLRVSEAENDGPIEETINQGVAEEDTVTLEDVVREQEILEEDANAVLGASDDENCTYDRGYVYRQALYSCLTCLPKSSPEQAGVCLACSFRCHDGHELVELYTKRNFRCDCGNEKFGGLACSLQPDKDRVNEKNQYNHNFDGEYCACNRPYPDPDDPLEDEMIQCVLCEDWFHGRHLGAPVPGEDNFSELICHLCVNRCPFLRSYGCEAGNESNVSLNAECAEAVTDKLPPADGDSTNGMGGTEPQQTDCKYFNMSGMVSRKGAVFFAEGWREQLCRCEKCMEMYDAHKCAFLTDSNDTVLHYERMGELLHNGSCDAMEKGMRLFQQQDRSAQIEQAYGYNELKRKLTEYLTPFAKNGQVVRKEDVDGFFTSIWSKKRPRATVFDSCGGGGGDDGGGSSSNGDGH